MPNILNTDDDEWQDSSGANLLLCAICEVENTVKDTKTRVSKRAITVYGGSALCRPHFKQLLVEIADNEL